MRISRRASTSSRFKPGKVTFCRLAEYDNQWKMLIATGEIIPSDETLAGTWSWVEVKDHAKLYRTLVEEGFVHHASMIHGDRSEALLQACKFLDIRARGGVASSNVQTLERLRAERPDC